MTKGNDCAFAHPGIMGNHSERGLTKREYFAVRLLARHGHSMTAEGMKIESEIAVAIADALIEALNKKASADPER